MVHRARLFATCRTLVVQAAQDQTLKLSKDRQRLGDKRDVLVRGEDWAEKISYPGASLLPVPAAETELATVVQLRTQERVYGSMSRDMRPRAWSWTPGALLAERDDEFDAKSCRGHTIEAIRDALEGLRGPVSSDYATGPHMTFCGLPLPGCLDRQH
jgi:hypothetical protein